MFISVLIRLSHTGQRFSEKVFCKGVQLYFEISLFEQNFYPYEAVYLVRKWTYENAEEKAHTFSTTSKTLKKNGRKSNTVQIRLTLTKFTS